MRPFMLLAVAALLAGCASPLPDAAAEPRVLTILTHESFVLPEAVVDAFEAEHDAEVRFVPQGDGRAVVNQAILTKDAPLADLLFGVDNIVFAEAKAAGIFEPYRPQGADTVREDLVFDETWTVTPQDYGYVNLNYDKARLAALGLEPPMSLADLTDPAWKGQLVVENPATSTPGLAFLLATIAHLGEANATAWWEAMRANDVVVAPGWSEAYFTHFAGGGEGDKALVVSYATSPPYAVREACTVDGRYVGLDACEADKEPPTGNVDAPGSAYLQIEAIGLLRGAKEPDLAKAFIDHTLTPAYQRAAAESMFVYPVVEGVEVPDYYALVEEPSAPAVLPAERVTPEDVQRWIGLWTEAVLR